VSAILTLRQSLRRLTALLPAACLTGLVASACFAASRDPNQDYKNFLAAADHAPKDGYTVYWLGRGFQAGGLDFEGPGVSDTEAAGFEAGGFSMSYSAASAQGGRVGLDVSVFTQQAWALSPSSQRRLPQNATTASVTAAAHSGTLTTVPQALTGTGILTFTFSLGDGTVIVVTTGPGIGPNGVDLNPLTNEQTFLNVLQDLRPYPQ
jgi:hypothetical protein